MAEKPGVAVKRGLSAYVPVRNGLRLDYCFELAIKSLLPIANEVIVSDAQSDDGTLEFLTEWARHEPKLRVVSYEWKETRNDPGMLPRWLNAIRLHCQYDMQLTMDADEVLCPNAYPQIRDYVERHQCAWFHRLNLWRDPYHISPEGRVCGTFVARLGQTDMMMVSDGWHTPEPPIRAMAIKHPALRIFHLGFLRRSEAFFAKSKIMQMTLANCYDPRLVEAEQKGGDWTGYCPFDLPLQDYADGHPELIKPWLRERGYSI